VGSWRRGRLLLAAALAAAAAVPGGSAPAAAAAPRTLNTELVGHLDPGGGLHADVWAYRGVAYLGSYRSGDCRPAPGVWAIDLRASARPRPLASFAAYPGSDGQDVWVGGVRTGAFRGDLAAVGVQPCDRGVGGFAGLALYDVTDPASPRRLAEVPTGVPSGVHELGVVQRPDGRVLALEAVPGSFQQSNGRRGDLRILDITDPRRPREVADWDVRRDGPPAARAEFGARRDVFCHSAWPFDRGRKLFASFWAAGEQFLDIDDPARPRLVGQTGYRAADRYRAAHSGWFNADQTLFVQNDETLQAIGQGAAATWTFQRIYDTRRLDRPVLVGTFATEDAVPGRDGRLGRPGVYSVHNAVIEGTREYVSWYSAGVRVVDLADPRRPRELAWFVPPAAAGRVAAGSFEVDPAPLVWGVYPYRGVVLASDMRSGLWVFRLRQPAPRATTATASGGTATPGAAASDRTPALLGATAALALGAGVLALALSRRRRLR
jgi:hypothetical protein